MADKKPEKKETSTEAVKKVDKKLPFFKRIGKWLSLIHISEPTRPY